MISLFYSNKFVDRKTLYAAVPDHKPKHEPFNQGRAVHSSHFTMDDIEVSIMVVCATMLTVHLLVSVCIFSILFSIHFQRG